MPFQGGSSRWPVTHACLLSTAQTAKGKQGTTKKVTAKNELADQVEKLLES